MNSDPYEGLASGFGGAHEERRKRRRKYSAGVAGSLQLVGSSIDLDFVNNRYFGGNLTSLLSCSRASSGYVSNSDGTLTMVPPNTLRLAGVGSRTNLFVHSQDLNNVSNVARATALDNNTIAPDGTLTATKLTDDNSNNTHYFANQINGIAAGAVFTQSVYAKLGGGTTGGRYVSVFLQTNNLTGYVRADFDLLTGVLVTSGRGGSVSTLVGASITSVGNGWFRLSVTGSCDPADNQLYCQYYLLDASLNTTYPGDSTSFAYFWGAQVEQASAASAYISTTTNARTVIPEGAIGTGLLIEDSRINFLIHSQAFTLVSNSGGAGLTNNATTAPDGTVTANKFIEGAGLVNPQFNWDGGSVPKAASAITYTMSVFIKALGAGSTRRMSLFCGNAAFTGGVTAFFNFSDGSYAGNAADTGAFVTVGHATEVLANGWTRVSLTFTSDTDVFLTPYISLSSTANLTSYVGDGVSGGYFWGAQLEDGAFVSSYIPTTTAASTRANDAVTVSASMLALLNGVAGTAYFASSGVKGTASATRIGAGGDFTDLFYFNFSLTIWRTWHGAGSFGTTLPSGTTASSMKLAVGWDGSGMVRSGNGSVALTDAHVKATDTLYKLGSDTSGNAQTMTGYITRFALFPTRQGDAALQALTT